MTIMGCCLSMERAETALPGTYIGQGISPWDKPWDVVSLINCEHHESRAQLILTAHARS